MLGPVELTSLCYGDGALLYSGTNSGHICVWDTETNHCFMTWEADEGEIGGCKCLGYLSELYQIPWELVREEKQQAYRLPDFSCAQKTCLPCWMQDVWGGKGSVTWVSSSELLGSPLVCKNTGYQAVKDPCCPAQMNRWPGCPEHSLGDDWEWWVFTGALCSQVCCCVGTTGWLAAATQSASACGK